VAHSPARTTKGKPQNPKAPGFPISKKEKKKKKIEENRMGLARSTQTTTQRGEGKKQKKPMANKTPLSAGKTTEGTVTIRPLGKVLSNPKKKKKKKGSPGRLKS